MEVELDEPPTEKDYDDLFQTFYDALKVKNEEVCNDIISRHPIMIQQKYGLYSESFLHVVGKFGSPELAQRLIDLGANVNESDMDRRTPIYNAMRNPLTETCKVLINHGADINIYKYNYRSPLQEALYFGSVERIEILVRKPLPENYQTLTDLERSIQVVEFILDHKDFNLTASDLSMLVFFAARLGDDDTFKLVLQQSKQFQLSKQFNIEYDRQGHKLSPVCEPKELNIRGCKGQTALHIAIGAGLPEVVKYLVNHGADLNATTECRSLTPLNCASLFQNKEIINILLKAGADVNSNITETSLRLVCGGGWHRMSLIIEFGFSYKEYSEYLEERCNSEIIEILIKAGANIDLLDDNGESPFHVACREETLDIVELLIKLGADLETKDREGRNALHHSALGYNLEVFEFLLSSGFDINSKDESENSVLHLLLQENMYDEEIEMMELFVSYGANINSRNDIQQTPLDIAEESYDYSVGAVECLLRLNAEIQIRTFGYYSLFYHSMQDSIDNEIFSISHELRLIAYLVMRDLNISDYIDGVSDDDRKVILDLGEKCKLEMNQMKKKRICNDMRFSFYEFLTLDIFTVTIRAKNENVARILKSGNYRNDFPFYKDFIERQIWRVESLKDSVEKTEDFLIQYREVNLPIFIIENILSYLQAADFRTFRRALLKKGNRVSQ